MHWRCARSKACASSIRRRLRCRSARAHIEAANYDGDLARLSDCDLVIEAIGERLDWKRELYARIAPHLTSSAALASNTSGLSLAALSTALPPALRPRFCGVHFFNPPRYMHLVELVPAAETDPALLDALEAFLTTALGKGVIRAKDTPNFIANRIGIFSVLATMRHADALGLGYDVVDALTGPAIGRAKSATYRTSDIVGLDTMAHVVATMHDALADDPWHALFDVPPVLAALVATRRARAEVAGGLLPQSGPHDRGARPDGATRTCPPKARQRRRSQKFWPFRTRTERFARLRESRASASPVPVGDPSRSLPLRCVPSSGNRGQRSRRRSRDPLGLRLDAGAVRAVAARGVARRRCLDRAGHRGGPCARTRAVAGLGRRSGKSTTPAAYMRRRARFRRRADAFVATQRAARLSPAALSRRAAERALRHRHDDLRNRRAALLASAATTSASCRSAPSSTRSAKRCSTDCCARSITPSARAPASSSGRRASRFRSAPISLPSRPPSSAAAGTASSVASRSSSRRRCGCATAWSPRLRRCAAWRSADRANSSCTAIARLRRSSRTSASSRRASGCCRQAAAARNWPCARPRT